MLGVMFCVTALPSSRKGRPAGMVKAESGVRRRGFTKGRQASVDGEVDDAKVGREVWRGRGAQALLSD